MTLPYEEPSLDAVSKTIAAYPEDNKTDSFLTLQQVAHNSHCALQQRITSQGLQFCHILSADREDFSFMLLMILVFFFTIIKTVQCSYRAYQTY
jgi:hypothetical protein